MEISGYRILVIDDEPAIGRMVRRYLEPKQQVFFEPVPTTALARLLEGECYDAIFCDVVMPELSGPALFTRLQAALPEQSMRVVFMTGGSRTSDAAAFLEQVENHRIDKPFSLRTLEVEIERVARQISAYVARGAGRWG